MDLGPQMGAYSTKTISHCKEDVIEPFAGKQEGCFCVSLNAIRLFCNNLSLQLQKALVFCNNRRLRSQSTADLIALNHTKRVNQLKARSL